MVGTVKPISCSLGFRLYFNLNQCDRVFTHIGRYNMNRTEETPNQEAHKEQFLAPTGAQGVKMSVCPSVRVILFKQAL